MDEKARLKQTNLFFSMQFYRLKHELDLVDAELYKNQQIPNGTSDGYIKRFFNSIGNEYRKGQTDRLVNKKATIKAEYDRFLKNAHEIGIELYAGPNLCNFINEVFSEDEDPYELEKLMFSIGIIFDSAYHYEYESEGLTYLSKMIWDNEVILHNIKREIEENYNELAKQPLSTKQKFILAGTAALALSIVVTPALSIAGLSGAGITHTLAGFGTAIGLGGTMVEGVGLIALAETLLDGAIIGFTYMALNQHNKNIVKKSFREMNFNSAAQLLAIKCCIMRVAKHVMPEDLFKEKMSELLQMISDLKSDTDYFLLVEEQNIDENKKKINVFHNLDKKLDKMFCA